MAMTNRDERSGEDLLLGAGAEFDGKLTFKGTVRVDARFKGSIVTDDVLIVGERARIDAEITCGSVIVHGEVNGNIHARQEVELLRSARVRGDVQAPSLTVEPGAVLQGSIRADRGEERDDAHPGLGAARDLGGAAASPS
jgi:cytoskeletal protein CcmA (bactofilin family)